MMLYIFVLSCFVLLFCMLFVFPNNLFLNSKIKMFFNNCIIGRTQPYSDDANSVVLFLIGSYYAERLTATLDENEITFSNGSKIWIGNKFFSYGYISLHNGEYNPLICLKSVKYSTVLDVYKLERKLYLKKFGVDIDVNSGSNKSVNITLEDE